MARTGFLKKKWLLFYSKIVKEAATPEYIARGWALGMFCGWFLPFGLQLIVSIPVSFLIRGSRIGAVGGTLCTNHFSIWFIYPFQCWLGNLFLKCLGLGGELSYSQATRQLENVIKEESLEALLELGRGVLAAFFAGGAFFALIFTPVTYYAVLVFVRNYRAKKALLKQKKMEVTQNANKA